MKDLSSYRKNKVVLEFNFASTAKILTLFSSILNFTKKNELKPN